VVRDGFVHVDGIYGPRGFAEVMLPLGRDLQLVQLGTIQSVFKDK
jgi:hypothetical protein